MNPSVRLHEELCILSIEAEEDVYFDIPRNQITEKILAARGKRTPAFLA